MKKLAVFLKSIVTCLLSLVLLFTLHYSLFTPDVHAQTPPTCGLASTPGQKVVDNYNREAITKTAFDDKIFNLNQWSGSVDSILVLLTGCSEIHPQTNAATQGTGALASSANMIASLYNTPPISGVEYLAGQFQKLNPVQPAYAQGVGYLALKPAEAIWTAFRNIAYVGFVLVFIVIGFMIMFRARVSPQAVATVQDSIPRIVVALILVTFSYAIVGLMIDFMFLFLNVVVNALPPSLLNKTQANDVIQSSIFGVMKDAWPEVIAETARAIKSILGNVVFTGIPGPLDEIIGWGLGGLAGVVVAIAAFFIMFRIFFMLLMAYIGLIIMTIFAPFILLFQALPGNNGAQSWLKQVVANLAVFPVVALMIFMAGMLGGIKQFGGAGAPAIDGTVVGQFPLISGKIDPSAVSRIIGLGFLFMIPSAANMIKERLKAGQGIAFGGPGAAALGGVAGWAGGTAARGIRESAPAQVGSAILTGRSRQSQDWVASNVPDWIANRGGGKPAIKNILTQRRSTGR